MRPNTLFKSVYSNVEILWTKVFRAGYILRREKILAQPDRGNMECTLTVAYTYSGEYLGDAKTAYFICKKKGLKPEIRPDSGNICSIGFNEKEQKWYGWSHRAIFGFGVGDTVHEGDCTASSGWTEEYLKDHPEEDHRLPIGFKAKTLEDAKKMAVAFADSVS